MSSALRRYADEGIHSSHPFKTLGKLVSKSLGDHEDANEDRQASHAKWLPPGVRSVVVGRNSQFFEEELNDEDLELLGALEYQATRLLTILLVVVCAWLDYEVLIAKWDVASACVDLHPRHDRRHLLREGAYVGQRIPFEWSDAVGNGGQDVVHLLPSCL